MPAAIPLVGGTGGDLGRAGDVVSAGVDRLGVVALLAMVTLAGTDSTAALVLPRVTVVSAASRCPRRRWGRRLDRCGVVVVKVVRSVATVITNAICPTWTGMIASVKPAAVARDSYPGGGAAVAG